MKPFIRILHLFKSMSFVFLAKPCNFWLAFLQREVIWFSKERLRSAIYHVIHRACSPLDFFAIDLNITIDIFPSWNYTSELKAVNIHFRELCLWDIEDGLCLQMNQIAGNHTGFYVSFYQIFLSDFCKESLKFRYEEYRRNQNPVKHLTFWRPMFPSYRDQSVDFFCKSTD